MVNFSYFLATSKTYQKNKNFFYNLLENGEYTYKRYFDFFMIVLIFISVAVLIREVKSHVNDYLLFFNNYVISFIFLVEYILRLWVNSSVSKIIIDQHEHDLMLGKKFQIFTALKTVFKIKIKYMLSVKALIDLRIFILFRVFKLFRYAKSIQTFTSIITAKKFEFFTLFIFASMVIFISSVLIYVMEANNPKSSIDTLFEALYWSIVTISTVGYGDITPITPEGRIVAMFVIVAGIAVFSFTTSLIVTSFTEKLDEIKDLKVIDDIAKIKEFYLICGYEEVAKEVAKKLSINNNIIILDENVEKVARAKRDGFMALNYNPGNIESYQKLRIDIKTQVKAILCLGESDVHNVYTAMTVRSFNKDVFILSLLKNKANKRKLTFAGVNEMFYEKELVGIVAKDFVGKPVAFEAIHSLRSNYTNVAMEELLVNERITQIYKEVGDLHNQRYKIVLLGVYKNSTKSFLFNPVNSTSLESGDYLLVMGNSQLLEEFNRHLHMKV